MEADDFAGLWPAPVDAVATLAAWVGREWSERVRIAVRGYSWGAVGKCRAGDGGEWFVACGNYGEACVYADTFAEVTAKLAEKKRAERTSMAEAGR